MVNFRKTSTKRYVVAFFITLLVFALGLSFGLVIDNERVRSIENENKMQKLDYESMQFQYAFMDTLNSTEGCVVVEKTLENSMKDLSESLSDIESYNEESEFNKDKFDLLSRQYTLDNLKYWMFAERAKSQCNADLVSVLYFFQNDQCPDCGMQGTVLTFYKKQLDQKLLIFPLNVENEDEESSLSVLKARYNITELPSLVIDDKVYSGLIGKKDFANIICHDYEDKPDFCEYEEKQE